MVKDTIFMTQEKLNVLLNIEENDKAKFEGLYVWSAKAMELSIKERLCKLAPVRGEIWTCDLGINVGSEMDKVRPCIIMSTDDYNRKSNLITVIPITHSGKLFASQVEMNDKTLAFKENSLDGISKIEQMRPLSKARFGRFIGRLSEEGMIAVEQAITHHLGIGSKYVAERFPYSAVVVEEETTNTQE